jgi:hypothetical protein
MKACRMTAITMVALCYGFTLAQAAPPTVTPSPGYDARLQESRNPPSSTPPATMAPATPPAATSGHTRKKHAK